MRRVLLAQPGYAGIEQDSYTATVRASQRKDEIAVGIMRPHASLLAHAFNLGVVACLNGGYDEFALLHGDIVPEKWWLDTLLDQREVAGVDVIHASSPIKDTRGLTSTAVAYTDDIFAPVRRITTKELATLPDVFTIDDIRTQIDADAKYLLPNTGCIVMRADTWFKEFPGFTIEDRVIHDDKEWGVDVCPEDWNFGHWCAANGVNVAGSKMRIQHVGRHAYDTSIAWGWDTDEDYFKNKQIYKEYCDAV